jgi:hypothetical protein
MSCDSRLSRDRHLNDGTALAYRLVGHPVRIPNILRRMGLLQTFRPGLRANDHFICL